MLVLFSKRHVQNRGEQSLDATLTTASHSRKIGLTPAGPLRPLEKTPEMRILFVIRLSDRSTTGPTSHLEPKHQVWI